MRVAMGRAPCCDKANVKRGPWSPEEDATLKNYVETHGTGVNWIALPKKAGFSLFPLLACIYIYIYIYTLFQHFLGHPFSFINIC